jgi:allene oxide cyclase
LIGITVISFKEEETMKKSLVITAVVSLLVGLFAGVFFTLHVTTSSASADQQKVVHVVEHAITDTVQEFHPPHLSLGDILGFHNPVFDAADEHQVGMDNGQCTRTVATGKTEWECFWTALLPHGQITVEGPYYDDGTDTTLTITGGTGVYLGAEGSMLLHARGNPLGSEYDFVYTIAE